MFTGTATAMIPGIGILSPPSVDGPFNSPKTQFLLATVDPAFTLAFSGFATNTTYTGLLFTVDVPTGTLPDFYGFASPTFTGPATLHVSANTSTGFIDALAPFSVLVTGATNGTGVPDGGATVGLMGLGLGAIFLVRRFRFPAVRSGC